MLVGEGEIKFLDANFPVKHSTTECATDRKILTVASGPVFAIPLAGQSHVGLNDFNPQFGSKEGS